MRRVPAVLLAALMLLAVVDVVAPIPVEAQSNPPIPRLRVDPDCIADPGSTEVRARGSGFQPNSRVRLTFEPYVLIGGNAPAIASIGVLGAGPPVASTAQAPPSVGTVRTDELGTFDTTVILQPPAVTRSVVFGRTFRLDARTVGGGPTATALLQTRCSQPAVTVDTGCSTADAGKKPAEVTIRARGFIAGDDRVQVEISQRGGSLVHKSVVSADGKGRIQVVVPIKRYERGDYEVLLVSPNDQFARAYFSTPCPTLGIRVQPDCARIGAPPGRMDVRVVASGFHEDQRVWVIWDGPRSHEFWNPMTDDDGRLVLTISPYRRGAGTYTLRIRSDDRESAVRQRSVRFEVPCEPTTLTTAQPCARPALQGDDTRRLSIDTSGTGFARGTVSVIFDADEIVEAETFLVDADAFGAFSLTITPSARPIGEYRIVARQRQADLSTRTVSVPTTFLEAETSFRSPCRDREPPPLVLDPVCGPEAPGQEAAYEITVRGTGFYPTSRVFITSGRGEEFTTRADRKGAFSTVIQPVGRGESRVPVRAQQRDTAGVVAAGAVKRFGVPCPIDPSIVIAPGYGPAGYTTLVIGNDFRPGTVVTLTWDRGIEAGRPTLVEVDEDGTFEIHVFILPNDWTGERTLVAGLIDDPGAFDDVAGTYVVTPGSGMPIGGSGDGFVDRR